MSDKSRYRVWPDGTVQDSDDEPYTHMSDDYQMVIAENEEEAVKLANKPSRPKCSVRGLIAPNRMCGSVIVGGVYCGYAGPCDYKETL